MKNLQAALLSETKIRTNEIRCSYEHLLVPAAFKDQDKKYSVSALISKEDTATMEVIKQAVDAAVQKGIDKFGKSFKSGKTHYPVHDGDEDRSEDEAYENCFYINCANTQKPAVFDENGQKTDDPEVIYSGVRGYLLINFYPYSAPGNQGVAASLLGFMKTRDDEALGGVRVDAAKDFGIDDDDFLS